MSDAGKRGEELSLAMLEMCQKHGMSPLELAFVMANLLHASDVDLVWWGMQLKFMYDQFEAQHPRHEQADNVVNIDPRLRGAPGGNA